MTPLTMKVGLLMRDKVTKGICFMAKGTYFLFHTTNANTIKFTEKTTAPIPIMA